MIEVFYPDEVLHPDLARLRDDSIGGAIRFRLGIHVLAVSLSEGQLEELALDVTRLRTLIRVAREGEG